MNTIKKILIFAGLAIVVPLSVSAMESKESDQTAIEQQIQEIVKGLAEVKLPSQETGKPFYPELDNVEKAEAFRRVIGQYLFDPATQSVRQNSTFIQQIKSLIDINPIMLPGQGSTVYSVAFSPDGKILAYGGHGDLGLKLFDVFNKQPITTLKLGNTVGTFGHIINSIAFSPDGKMVAGGNHDTTIELWNISSNKPIATLSGHTGYVNSVAFSPDGKQLASGSHDDTVRLWDIASNKMLQFCMVQLHYQ